MKVILEQVVRTKIYIYFFICNRKNMTYKYGRIMVPYNVPQTTTYKKNEEGAGSGTLI